jgi:hypothetical protein
LTGPSDQLQRPVESTGSRPKPTEKTGASGGSPIFVPFRDTKGLSQITQIVMDPSAAFNAESRKLYRFLKKHRSKDILMICNAGAPSEDKTAEQNRSVAIYGLFAYCIDHSFD